MNKPNIPFSQLVSNMPLQRVINKVFEEGSLMFEVRVLATGSDDNGVWDAWFEQFHNQLRVSGRSAAGGTGEELEVWIFQDGTINVERSSSPAILGAEGWNAIGIYFDGPDAAVSMMNAVVKALTE